MPDNKKDVLLEYIGRFDHMIDDLATIREAIVRDNLDLADTELGRAIAALARAQGALIKRRENVRP